MIKENRYHVRNHAKNRFNNRLAYACVRNICKSENAFEKNLKVYQLYDISESFINIICDTTFLYSKLDSNRKRKILSGEALCVQLFQYFQFFANRNLEISKKLDTLETIYN